jgi:hypothetical protein
MQTRSKQGSEGLYESPLKTNNYQYQDLGWTITKSGFWK